MSTKAEAKIIQYLTEAHGKEKELEIALEAHIGMANRKAYKGRLRDHLKETKGHARLVERRLKQLDGDGLTKMITANIGRGLATAKGPLHAMRGASAEEKELKNAKTEYSEEHEEIATYIAIETLATELGDTETAKLARQIRRDEERMASFLEKQIPAMAKAVAKAEVPASERKTSGRSKRSASTSKKSKSSTTRRKSTTASKRKTQTGRASRKKS